MTFAAFETSQQGSAPIEAYAFRGTNSEFFLTSYASEFTFDSNVYTPTAIQRKGLKIGTQEEEQLALEVTLPFDHPMVREYAYSFAPPDLTLELVRVFLDSDFVTDNALLWKGRVTSFSVTGRDARMQIPTIFAYLLTGNTPNPRYQRPCNNRLYDLRCKVDPVTHQVVTTVVSVAGTIVQVASQPFGATELLAGEMIRQSTGEARMIVGQSGTSLTITYPFSALDIGEDVLIRKGCDHALSGDCLNRFANTNNFGGFAIVPPRNPFESI